MELSQILPPADLFTAFLIAGIALNLTPGSDMFAVLCGLAAKLAFSQR